MPLPLIPVPSLVARADGVPLRLAPLATRDDALSALAAVTSVKTDETLAAEAYRVRVDEAGVEVEAADDAGAFYARQTLRQLLVHDDDGWRIDPVSIADAPRFTHRGLMLDVARHFHPVATVTWLIDRMAELKLNRLHLHLTDDQGWRIELRSRPELTARASASGAGGDAGGFYTHDDWRAILAHAAARHVVVIPEIDLPGHTHAVGLAYPELAAAPVITDEVRAVTALYGGGLPEAGVPYTGIAVGFSSLVPGSDAVGRFLDDVLRELAALTPGPFLHIGGDEALGTDPADYAALVAEAGAIVAETGKTVVAWHEAGGTALPPGSIGQFWGYTAPAPDHAARALAFAAAGGHVILSPADAIYLDMKYDDDSVLGLAWADGPTSVERSYRWEPTEVIPALEERSILGVEAALWTETIRTRAGIERMAFPRIASAAEIAWSPANARDWTDYRERLAALGTQWAEAGIGFERAAGVDWMGDDESTSDTSVTSVTSVS